MYLPQFHPIPENDQWWGTGFTEWTNVAKAKPLFSWHDQPQLPTDLGYYDLRLAETRAQQAALARAHGIHGFCYYHYWFDGRRLLERPFNEVLSSGQPDFPFCLCWANENWTRTWDGGEKHVLMAQRYSADGHREHLRWLCRAFSDARYIRVENRPVFLVYRALAIPDLARTADLWRDVAREEGVGEIFLCNVESFSTEHQDPRTFGFDAAVEFQPDWSRLGSPLENGRLDRWRLRLGLTREDYGVARVFEYATVVERMLAKPRPAYPRFPCVTPMWDNSPRRKEAPVIFKGSTPELYETWLRGAVDQQPPASGDRDLFFLNAWNEWGEGNHLEPCRRWGRAYLEATRRVLAPRLLESAPVAPRRDPVVLGR